MTDLQPGDILNGRWVIQDLIGTGPDPDAPCDAPNGGSYMMIDGKIRCRCTVCARCGHHTGNSHQGHYWGFCKVTRTVREGHFCCEDPAYGCALEATA